jgi:hypothetical protein
MEKAEIYILGRGEVFYKLDDIISFSVDYIRLDYNATISVTFRIRGIDRKYLAALRDAPSIIVSFDNMHTIFENVVQKKIIKNELILYCSSRSNADRTLKKIKLNLIKKAI